MQNIVKEAHQKNLLVMLCSSCLKNEELGTDKYSAGKIICLPSPTASIATITLDRLKEISEYSTKSDQPAIASYLQMINEICRDKFKPTSTAAPAPTSTVQPATIPPATKTKISHNPKKKPNIATLFSPRPSAVKKSSAKLTTPKQART